MPTLFRLDSSIRTEGSVSREIADTAERGWLAEHPDGVVVRRDIGQQPVPLESLPAAFTANFVAADQRTPEQVRAVELAGILAQELLDADAYLFAVPLYNFGVPANLKAWLDLVITSSALAPGTPPALAGRPAVLVIARGGGYGEGTPRYGWDHSTPWLERILSDVFQLDLKTVATELTLADVNPAMADLRDLAAQLRAQAHETATEHAKHIAAA
jgi:FMN-dependent NADH-azoreductase